MSEVFTSGSEPQTEQLGESFAANLHSGDVVALRGELGAGKTAFARGILRALGWQGEVTSPTFTILNLYDTTPPVAHFDVYRLNEGELYNTGFYDYCGGSCITLVEWPELIDGALGECWCVAIERSGDDARKITITSPKGIAGAH